MPVSLRLLNEPKNSAHDALAQHGNVEVDEKADLPTAQTQVGDKLSFVDRRQAFQRLHLHDDRVGHHQVYALATIELQPFVDD